VKSWPFRWPWPTIRRVPLTPEQNAQVTAVLNARGTPGRCEVCGHVGTMGLVPETAQIAMAFAPNILGAGAMPCAVVVCSNCGNVRLHALGPLGLQAVGNRPGP
jgi:hypothetical protein